MGYETWGMRPQGCGKGCQSWCQSVNRVICEGHNNAGISEHYCRPNNQFFLFDEVLPFAGCSRCYAVYYCTTERDDPCTIAHHDGGVQSGAEKRQPMTVV